MAAAASYKIAFSTLSAPRRVVTCKSHALRVGEGINGPQLLTWWDNADKEGEPTGFAAQVTGFEAKVDD